MVQKMAITSPIPVFQGLRVFEDKDSPSLKSQMSPSLFLVVATHVKGCKSQQGG